MLVPRTGSPKSIGFTFYRTALQGYIASHRLSEVIQLKSPLEKLH